MKVIQAINKLFNIYTVPTTPYYPQNHGLVERLNPTILSMLTRLYTYQKLVVPLMPADKQFSPYSVYLMFEHTTRIPLGIMFGTPPVFVSMFTLWKRLAQYFKMAREHLEQLLRDRSNTTVCSEPYQEGDHVCSWLHNPE